MIPKWVVTKILEFIMKEFGNRVTKYVDKPNELDVGYRDLDKKVTDDGFRITAAVDMIKSYAEKIDNVTDKVRQIDKVIDKFDDKLQQIGKIAHPPAIPLKDINELKESAKDVRWMMVVFRKMQKISLLKSIFK